jgi:hypothetical protein
MQGGLGMFQFDAGTYAETLALYGDSILTIEGNTAQAVSYVADRVQMHIAGVDGWLSAMTWLNDIPMDASDPKMDAYASFIVCRYNGCCTPTSSTCQMRAAGYRDNAIKAFNEMGAEFWRTDNRCPELPPDGVIDQRSDCYIAAGDPRFWHRETGGVDGDREWTGTSSAAAPANFARWIVKASGLHTVEVHLDGEFGNSARARYTILHAGITDEVVIDQAAASEWVLLGEYDFAGTGDEYIMLGDNTGEPGAMGRKLLFDAVRVTSLEGGCCSSTRGSGSTAALASLFVMLVLRRRARRAPRA